MRDKEWWSCVKTAGGARKSSTISLLDDTSGGEHASNKGKADCIASYFANKSSLSLHDLQEEQLPPLPQPSTLLVSFIHFWSPEVRRLLKRLNTSKATGPGTPSLRECSKNARKKCYVSCQIVCSILSHWCAARHVENSQRCSHS